MVPLTLTGRILCIVFGLVGIPLLLITIADIGKFLSDLITFIYRKYRAFKTELRRKSKRFNIRLPIYGASYAESVTSSSVPTDPEELSIPVWIVFLFLTSYTALGGFLFQYLEGWDYFDAFYYCFITMATIGFGDLVPTEQMYMFFTMIYIIIGLAVTTMCIDLAGTEYIRKIHYFGQKMETAKEMFGEIQHVGEDFMKHAGEVLNVKNIAMMRKRGLLPYDVDFEGDVDPQLIISRLYGDPAHKGNVLYEPLPPDVRRILGPNIRVRPDEIKEGDAFILENKMYGRPTWKRVAGPWGPRSSGKPTHIIVTAGKAGKTEHRRASTPVLIAPFILPETNL